MESYTYLLLLAIILLSTKVFGLLTEHVHLPQVVGALLAGIIMGPSGLGVLESTDFLIKTAEIGVIMLMFTAGIDTDMKRAERDRPPGQRHRRAGGVRPPVPGAAGCTSFLLRRGVHRYNLLKSAFMGSVFSATSVSITVETLNEMGKLKTKTGTTLLSAALIDDIIGIVVLSILSAFSSGDSDPVMVMVHIVLFFVFVLGVGLVVRRIFTYVAEEHWHSRRVAVWSLAFCLLMAYCSEEWFGVADITGAYFAGLILCNVTKAGNLWLRSSPSPLYGVYPGVLCRRRHED
ncbi:Na(+)/H(+)-K(+) antiporter GerN [Firmicutes bacterium ASF500]|nr:Na(+)/H(+)-K(+) antiporter GerN [Firmicutes bacterium ASF500]